ncbi:MAG: amino acid ABC transporter substrate-binding protein [Alphaproteobacteria bacterium]|nr:amino acid ABC transporter substrate-binding protein [Alphaproteobacteria bacterium]
MKKSWFECHTRVVRLAHIAQVFGLALVFGAALTGFSAGAVAAEKTLKVGAPLPLTGPLSPEGLKQKEGYDLWAEQVNKTGGIKVGGDTYKIQIIYSDYQSNTPRAVQLAEKLITVDKVNFLFSPFGSGATKAASAVSEKYGIPTIAATASSTAVYNQGYKYLFGTFTPNSTLTTPLAALVRQKMPNVKRVAILARNDLFPLAIANVMNGSAKKSGFSVVAFEKYSIGTLDHATTLTKLRATRPDWVFATGYINDLILIRKQMRDVGLRVPVVTMIAGPAYKEYAEALGKQAENVTSAAWWHPAVRYTGGPVFGSTVKYNELFQAKYKKIPDYAQASSSAAGVILQLGIQKAGSIDPKKVRDALASLDAKTFYGPVRFGPNGQITSLDPPVFQIQGGKPVVVLPAAVKQADLKPIK